MDGITVSSAVSVWVTRCGVLISVRIEAPLKKIGLVLLCLFCGACAQQPPPQYQWGSYEGLLYDMYVKPDRATPVVQIERLRADIQRASENNVKIPPGVYAHLGYMHYLNGQLTAAKESFAMERRVYPESAVFIDRFLARLEKQNAARLKTDAVPTVDPK